jgi:ArsR family transcriptional regulator, arsenate/arsenite/antimonite-responsive transcriptional repressor
MKKNRMDTKKIARVLKALSNTNRLELYLEIAKKCEASFEADCRECLVTDIMGSFNIGAPTISHHLKELADAGLITTERKGKFLVARVDQATIGDVYEVLSIGQGK